MSPHCGIFVVLFFAALCQAFELPPAPAVSADVQIAAVQGLLVRVVGASRASQFSLAIIPSQPENQDVFTISGDASTVQVQGTNGVALSSGIYWYLRYYVNSSFTWGDNNTGVNVALPARLPLVPSTTRRSLAPLRYYMNVCTLGYSTVWWTFERWEKEIDWMALHGVNLPEAFVGQEYIWEQTFLSLGLTPDDLVPFFVGAPFLPWGRMGNIQGWGGPLSAEWRANQAVLQHRLLARMRSFGMRPVLPAFAGFIPAALPNAMPGLNYTVSSAWLNMGNYSSVLLLNPQDARFAEIGALFLRLYALEFGTDHIYNADTFNEMKPSSGDLTYLKETSAAVLASIQQGDPQGKWIMQAWLFLADPVFWTNQRIEAYLSGVSKSDLLLLDLAAEAEPQWVKTNSFFGYSYVWCMLHNYGGKRGIYGSLPLLATAPFAAASNSSLVGLGISPEAIETNPVVYELMAEVTWHSAPINLTAWLQQWAISRYGSNNADAQLAWTKLVAPNGPYTHFIRCCHGFNLIEDTPTIYPLLFDTWMEYNTTLLVETWDALVRSSSELASRPPFLYDYTDITRQVLANFFYGQYNIFASATQAKDLTTMQRVSQLMQTIIVDLDALLASDINYLLGRWIQAARASATTLSDEFTLVFDARNQITNWGPDGVRGAPSYARRPWSGLYTTYYLPRWTMWLESVCDAVRTDQAFQQSAYNAQRLKFQLAWVSDVNASYPTATVGSSNEIIQKLYTKYRPLLGVRFDGTQTSPLVSQQDR